VLPVDLLVSVSIEGTETIRSCRRLHQTEQRFAFKHSAIMLIYETTFHSSSYKK
jgi:hypothetical protein